jgi:hypothetical protein
MSVDPSAGVTPIVSVYVGMLDVFGLGFELGGPTSYLLITTGNVIMRVCIRFAGAVERTSDARGRRPATRCATAPRSIGAGVASAGRANFGTARSSSGTTGAEESKA